MKAGRVSWGRGGAQRGGSRVAQMLRRKRSWEIRALLLSQFDVFIKLGEFGRICSPGGIKRKSMVGGGRGSKPVSRLYKGGATAVTRFRRLLAFPYLSLPSADETSL